MLSPHPLWARRGVLAGVLLPLAGAFALASALRRLAYRRGWLPRVAVGVPVLVVGNLTAGGSGKTPLVLWLLQWLRARGYRPGVVSRGYGGSAQGCVEVEPASAAAAVGDEPLLIRRKSGAPVVVGRDRVAATRTLLARHPGIDVVVADDGLQHYRLRRDHEIVVVDAASGFGNGWPLPAGPLREPLSRLRTVDAVVQGVRGGAAPRALDGWRADYVGGSAYRLRAPAERCPLAELPARDWLAATGIGRPQGFFDMLAAAGVRASPRAFPDHHAFAEGDLPAAASVLMTEKDAVKCLSFAGADWWAVELEVRPQAGFIDWLGTRFPQQ